MSTFTYSVNFQLPENPIFGVRDLSLLYSVQKHKILQELHFAKINCIAQDYLKLNNDGNRSYILHFKVSQWGLEIIYEQKDSISTSLQKNSLNAEIC